MKYILATGIMAYSLVTTKAMPPKMDKQLKREMEGMNMADLDMQNWMDQGMEMDLPWMNGQGMDMEHMINMQNMENMQHGEEANEGDMPQMADVVEQLMQDQQMREIIQKWRDNTSQLDQEEKEYTESDSGSDNYDNVVVTRVDNSFVYIKPIVNNNNAVISNENEGNTNINNNNMLLMFGDDGAKKIDWEQLMEAMEEWEASSAMKTPVMPMTGTMEDEEETESSETEVLPEESEFDFSEEPISVWSPDTPTWTVDTPQDRESPSYTCVNCLFDGEEQPEEVVTPVEEETEGEAAPVEEETPAQEETEGDVVEEEVEASEVIPEIVEDILEEISEVEFSEVNIDDLPF